MRKAKVNAACFAGLMSSLLLMSKPSIAQQDRGSIRLNRTLESTVVAPGSTIKVSFVLNKGYGEGVGRLDEFIPYGFTATEGESAGSRFYVDDTIAKFAWTKMPFDSAITLSYQLTVPDDADGDYSLIAQFSYVTSDGASTVYFKPCTFTVHKEEVILVPPLAKPKETYEGTLITHDEPLIHSATVVSMPPVSKENTVTKSLGLNSIIPASSNNTASSNANKPKNITYKVNEPKNNVCYRVQIMASAQRLDVDSVFINGIKDKLYILTKNGISRYFVGAFHELQPAIDYRDKIISNGLKGPFVVAYNNGVKITIKESIAIVATY